MGQLGCEFRRSICRASVPQCHEMKYFGMEKNKQFQCSWQVQKQNRQQQRFLMDPFAPGQHRSSSLAAHPGPKQSQSLSGFARDAPRFRCCFWVVCIFFCSWEAAGEEGARGQFCFSLGDLMARAFFWTRFKETLSCFCLIN